MNKIPDGWEVVKQPNNSQKSAIPEGWEVVSNGDEEDNFLTGAARTALQIPQGAAEGILARNPYTGPAMAYANIQGMQTPYGPFSEERSNELELQQQNPQEFGPGVSPQLQYEPFAQGFNEANPAPYLPTVSNIGGHVEKYTGLPLQPKTEGQRALRFASGFATGGPTAAASIPAKIGGGAAALGAIRGGRKLIEGEEAIRQKLGIAPDIQLTPEQQEALSYLAPFALFPVKSGKATPNPRAGQQQLDYHGNEFAKQNPKAILPQRPGPNPQTQIAAKIAPRGGNQPSNFAMGNAIQQYAQQYQPQGPQGPKEAILPESPIEPMAPREPLGSNVPRPEAPRRPSAADKQEQGNRQLAVSPQPIRPTTLRPAPQHAHNPVEDRVGNLISRETISNPYAGGQALHQVIGQKSAQDREVVTQNYRDLDEYSEGMTMFHPELMNELHAERTRLRPIRNRSAITTRKLQALDDTINMLGSMDANGNITGFHDVNVRAIRDEIQELNKLNDYDFQHGGAKSEFKNVVAMMNQAIQRTFEHFGNEAGIEASQRARDSYIDWQNTYTNNIVHPFLDRKDFKPEAAFNRATTLDDYNQIRHVLERDMDDPASTRQAQQLQRALLRHLTEKRLAPYLRKSSAYTTKDFMKELGTLESVLTPEEAQQIKNIYLEVPSRGIRATNVSKEQEMARKRYKEQKAEHETIIKEQRKAHAAKVKEAKAKPQLEYEQSLDAFIEKHKGEKELATIVPEKIMDKLNTVSGTRQFKHDMAKLAAREKAHRPGRALRQPSRKVKGEELIQDALDYKASDLITKGKVSPDDKAKSLVELLKDKEALALLNEYKGAEWVNDLKELAQRLEGEEAAFAKYLEETSPKFYSENGELIEDTLRILLHRKTAVKLITHKLIKSKKAIKLMAQKAEAYMKEKQRVTSEKVKGTTYAGKKITSR